MQASEAPRRDDRIQAESSSPLVCAGYRRRSAQSHVECSSGGGERATVAARRGCRVNPAWCVAAVEISNEPAVSALGVAAERDGWGKLIVAVGDIHTAESFPDSLRRMRKRSP
jgi:hypothetical protein